MDVLIIEDEKPAALRLQEMISERRSDCNIKGIVDGVQSAKQWLLDNPSPDLIFMDIQLSDGLSFDIFSEVSIQSPVIFITAYDQYAIKAFKYNSVDYLLKPIDSIELEVAITQFEKQKSPSKRIDRKTIESILGSYQKQVYKERFLVKLVDQLTYIKIEDIAYFYSEDGLLFLTTSSGKRYVLENTIDGLVAQIDPKSFYRINRKILLKHDAIDEIHVYSNSRLKLELKPKANFDIIVARERVKGFKSWLDS